MVIVRGTFACSPQELFEQAPRRSPFTYEITNGNFCLTSSPDAIVFVISKSSNFESRSAVRRTWGNLAHAASSNNFPGLQVRLVFLIDIDESRLKSVELEQKLFHDIIQVHLPQHYTLSTYRDMALLHWTETFCPRVKLTIKTDDDVFLNTYLLLNVIKAILANTTKDRPSTACSASHPHGRIYGVVILYGQVVRYSNDPVLEGARYIVTDDEYPCRKYPHYVSGFGYMIDHHARAKLLCTFYRDPKPFYMSDVYVTGILPEYISIPRVHLGLVISYRSSDDCEKFFSQPDSAMFACASSMHYTGAKANVFERFNAFGKRVDANRHLYLDRRFLL